MGRNLRGVPGKRCRRCEVKLHLDDYGVCDGAAGAADATREAVQRWLREDLGVSVGHRRCSRDPSSKNDAGSNSSFVIMQKIPYATTFVQ